MTVLYKKYTYGLLLIATTLIGCFCNFTNATNYTCSDSYFTITEDSYLILNKFTGRGYFEIGDTNNTFCYSIGFTSNGLNYSNDCIVPSSFPIILSAGNYYTSCGNYTYSSFSIIPESSGGTCDYSDYELKTDITENYCKNKFSSLMTQLECNTQYDGYIAPNIYQICSNSLNTCSNELSTCNTTLTACMNGNYTGNVMWSALYINNIQHLSNEIINITIPEEIERDYANIDNTTDIEITGYGYDQNAMQQMVNTQFTPPTSEDLENVIGKIADFLPLLAIMLLIVYAWRLIKKVF